MAIATAAPQLLPPPFTGGVGLRRGGSKLGLLELHCLKVTLLNIPAGYGSIQLELDTFVIGRTRPKELTSVSLWDNCFPVASNGLCLRFRLFCGDRPESVEDCGESSVDFQALLAKHAWKAGAISVPLVMGSLEFHLSPAKTFQRARRPADVKSSSNRSRLSDGTANTKTGENPTEADSTLEGLPRKRLVLTPKGKDSIVELMQNKDKMHSLAGRPFEVLDVTEMNFEQFRATLPHILDEIGMKGPGTAQLEKLFHKHRRNKDGLSREDFETLIFRLLCFLRATHEVHAEPLQSHGERDKQWRQDFIKKNPRRFDDVYEKQRELGRGSFGTVYMVKSIGMGKKRDERVCKIISKGAAKEGTSDGKVREEFAVLKRLDHPHVLRIFEDFEDDENFYVVMEPCRGGDLQEFRRGMDDMDALSYERWVAKVLHQTLTAVAYCHGKGVIHKDLKPENIMLASRNTVEKIHVVVVDFGLAEVFSDPCERTDIISGTPPYMAPEVWFGCAGKACDIWSCGVIIFLLLAGRLPFAAKKVTDFAAAVMLRPDWGMMGGATADALSFTQSILKVEESARPTAQEALMHSWFADCRRFTATADEAHIKNILDIGNRSNFEKFMSRLIATQMDASQQQRMTDAFHAFDTNGDGWLSHEELRQGLKTLGVPPDYIEQVIGELDVGSTGQISYTAFLAGAINLKNIPAMEQESLLLLAWQQFSPNKQGLVSVAAAQDALALRGMAVADIPVAFLAELQRERSGLINFDRFTAIVGVITERSSKRWSNKLFHWIMKARQ